MVSSIKQKNKNIIVNKHNFINDQKYNLPTKTDRRQWKFF